jgi:hypothetical protein
MGLGKVAVVRPGLIVGPEDPSDRFIKAGLSIRPIDDTAKVTLD